MIPFRKQQGAVLIVSLMILVIMTLIGITAMQTTTLEEMMAGNTRDRELAFQSAEVALREGEALVEELANISNFSDGTTDAGLYGLDNAEPDFFAATSWTTANSRAYGSLSVNGVTNEPVYGVASTPRYIIRYITMIETEQRTLNVGRGSGRGYTSSNTAIDDVYKFRITARGTGGSDQAQVLLQSYYGKIL